MTVTCVEAGPLVCRLVDRLPPGAAPSLLVVLCHGFGAPGSDLVSIGEQILDTYPALSPTTRFVFPVAPLSPKEFSPFGGRAWWMIDVGSIERRLAQGRMQELLAETPQGIGEARRKLLSTIDILLQKEGLDFGQVVLGGFSQGAMLATDLALRADEAPAALCLFSGCLLSEPEWKRLALRRAGLEVVQTHAVDDPLLPFALAERLRDLLHGAGLAVDWFEFEGGHTIPEEGLERLATVLVRKAALAGG